MAWKAYIANVEENQGPADVLGVNVEFRDETTGRSVTRWYKVASFGATADDLKEVVRQELQKLESFDEAAGRLRLMVGQEIV